MHIVMSAKTALELGALRGILAFTSSSTFMSLASKKCHLLIWVALGIYEEEDVAGWLGEDTQGHSFKPKVRF